MIESTRTSTLNRYRALAEKVAQVARRIQDSLDRKGKKPADKKKDAVQVGQREYPEEFEAQTLEKPGIEADLETAPMFEAPSYEGSNKLRDSVAIITGGDSGIGRAIAVLYAREGADIAIVYLTEDEDAELTKRAVEVEGRRCILLSGDVADPEFCKAAVDETVKAFGRLDILVNNAAYQQQSDSIGNVTVEQLVLTLKTNLCGYFFMAQAAIPHMQHGSVILMTGSVTGIKGSKHLLDYSMTKGGIHAFTRSLAASLVDKGIRVNCVAPGPVWTPLNPADKPPQDVKEFGCKTTMRRAAQPEEIAPAFVFLASRVCSSYITGEILPIVGGYGHN